MALLKIPEEKGCARLVTAQWSVGKPGLWGDHSQARAMAQNSQPAWDSSPCVYDIQGFFMASCHFAIFQKGLVGHQSLGAGLQTGQPSRVTG